MQIVLFGDSLMAGYGISKPHHLSEVLKLELKNLKIESEVINASVSGDTTRGGLNRIQWTLQDKADLIVLGLGANDMLRGIEPKEIKENLNQIIKSIKNKNIPIVLAGFVAPDSYEKNYKEAFDDIYRALSKEYNLTLMPLSKEYNLTLMPFLLEGVALNPKLNIDDGKHPNPEGVKIMAKNLAPYILKEIKK